MLETTGRIASSRPPHPGEDLLLRFLRGNATRPESRAVVRHLLTGCRECLAVTRPVWGFADDRIVKLRALRPVVFERDICQP